MLSNKIEMKKKMTTSCTSHRGIYSFIYKKKFSQSQNIANRFKNPCIIRLRTLTVTRKNYRNYRILKVFYGSSPKKTRFFATMNRKFHQQNYNNWNVLCFLWNSATIRYQCRMNTNVEREYFSEIRHRWRFFNLRTRENFLNVIIPDRSKLQKFSCQVFFH